MADKPASLDAIERAARVLVDARVPYAFIGGVAMGAWAVPRPTFDLDLAVASGTSELPALLQAFERAGFVVEDVFRKGFADRIAGMEKVHVHLPSGSALLAVDLFLATTPFLHSLLERRKTVDLGGGPLQVCTAADLILLKLVADRPKDRLDVENLLAVQGVPEREYLEQWAERLEVRRKLDAVLARSP
jgi:hypothetical protein